VYLCPEQSTGVLCVRGLEKAEYISSELIFTGNMKPIQVL